MEGALFPRYRPLVVNRSIRDACLFDVKVAKKLFEPGENAGEKVSLGEDLVDQRTCWPVELVDRERRGGGDGGRGAGLAGMMSVLTALFCARVLVRALVAPDAPR